LEIICKGGMKEFMEACRRFELRLSMELLNT